MKRRSRSRSSIHILPTVVSVAVFVVVTWIAYRWCYLPYQCNIFKRAAEAAVTSVESLNSPVQRGAFARHNLEQSMEWIARCPDDLELYMIAAGSLRELGRSDQAIPMYEHALKLDRRPEIYLNLGETQMESGQVAEAIPNLAAAVLFDPNLLPDVPPILQQPVQTYIRTHSGQF